MEHEQSVPGFAIKLIPLVRCPREAGELALAEGFAVTPDDPTSVQSGRLFCQTCGSEYGISDGILNLLNQDALDEASANEQKLRNDEQSTFDDTSSARAHHEMEMLPTLAAVPLIPGQTILELGCGEGRYTRLLAGRAQLLAVDFSIELLRVLQRHLPPGTSNIGLVLGDITTLKVQPGRFDYALSTLTSNLPSRSHRESLYRLACGALAPTGRFVFSSHLQGIHERLTHQQKSGQYTPGGIYRYNFGLRESATEVRPYFEKVDARPIQIYFPFSRTFGLPVVKLSRMLEHVPLVNLLGHLVLVQASRPRLNVSPSEIIPNV